MDIERIHEINLLLLKKLDEVCRKNNIKYFLFNGTLLGAIRDNGFIPWDDDCDVAMKREDYEKFKAISKKEFNEEEMEVIFPERNNTFHDFITRIIYKKEVYRKEKIYEDYNEGVFKYLWVDIFILDDVYSKESQKIKNYKLKFIYGLAISYRRKINFKEYRFLEKIVIFILSKIGKIYKLETIYSMYEKEAKKVYGKKEKIEFLYVSNYPIIYIDMLYRKNWFDNVEEKIFEDTKFYISKNYKEILDFDYGDYMELPKKEERVQTHKILKV